MFSFKKKWGAFILVFIWTVVFFQNINPNSFLSGWDNLHPEFNFPLALTRSFFSVWQEYRGLGLVAGMGHAADMPRELFTFLLSVIFPEQILRQMSFFLTILVGMFGVYYLLREQFFKGRPDFQSQLGGFVAAIYYFFNLYMAQMFYLPFEPFAFQFAFLPWLILFARKLVGHWSNRNLAVFVFINILAIPQAFVPTVFLVYLFCLIVFLAFSNLKKALVILVITLLVNAFWILPFGYFSATNILAPVESKGNQISTERSFLENKQFGHLSDVVLLKSFTTASKDFLPIKSGENIFFSYKNFVNNPLVKIGLSLMFLVTIFGVVGCLVKKRDIYVSTVIIFLVSLTLLANSDPPFSWVDTLFYKLPLVSQVLRMPFTKFSTVYVFSFSILLSLGSMWVGEWIDKFLKRKSFGIGVPVAICLVSIFSVLPILMGGLFYKPLSVNFPQEYKSLFSFLSDYSTGRIANFPQYDFWGWRGYSFGYRGAGFIWFGIEQPILDRAFDTWSREDENYYWEISYALYSKNLTLFENTLEKYRVSSILIDENVVNPGSSKSLFNEELTEIIGSSSKFDLVFQSGKLKVYSVNLDRPTNKFVSITSSLPRVSSYKWGNLDQAFQDFGDYQEGSDVNYSYRTLFTGKRQEDIEFETNSIPTKNGRTFIVNKECSNKVDNIIDCATIYLPDISHDKAYFISVESKNSNGLPLTFWVENLNSRKSDLETYLPKGEKTSSFIVPPMESDGLGYALHFDNPDVTLAETNNYVGKVKISEFDFPGLISQKQGNANRVSYLPIQGFAVYHPNPSWYQVDFSSKIVPGNLLVTQSFDNGWVAWDQNGKILNHIKVNNWANGWDLTGDEQVVYVLFWPQILEFIGFGLLGGLILFYTVKVWAKLRTGF